MTIREIIQELERHRAALDISIAILEKSAAEKNVERKQTEVATRSTRRPASIAQSFAKVTTKIAVS